MGEAERLGMTDWHDTSTPVGRIRAVLDSGSFVVPASVLTMGANVDVGEPDSRPRGAGVTAWTDRPKPVTAENIYAERVGVVTHLDGADVGPVEHTRQSRLQRWQRLP